MWGGAVGSWGVGGLGSWGVVVRKRGGEGVCLFVVFR